MDYMQIIEEKGLMKKYIAKKIGVSPTMLSLFLHKKKNLTPVRLRALHSLLDINKIN